MLLLTSLFLRHAPEIIEDGRLYQVQTPFYEICHKGRQKLFYSDEEFKKFEERHGKQNNVKRYKGLGALSEKLVDETVMGDKRKLVQIKMDDINEMIELFDILMGKNIAARRLLVSEGVI